MFASLKNLLIHTAQCDADEIKVNFLRDIRTWLLHQQGFSMRSPIQAERGRFSWATIYAVRTRTHVICIAPKPVCVFNSRVEWFIVLWHKYREMLFFVELWLSTNKPDHVFWGFWKTLQSVWPLCSSISYVCVSPIHFGTSVLSDVCESERYDVLLRSVSVKR